MKLKRFLNGDREVDAGCWMMGLGLWRFRRGEARGKEGDQ